VAQALRSKQPNRKEIEKKPQDQFKKKKHNDER
jgi:hypothetical protein